MGDVVDIDLAKLNNRVRRPPNMRPPGITKSEAVDLEVRRDKRKCSWTKDDGDPCDAWAIRGGTVCTVHGGNHPAVQAQADRVIQETREGVISLGPKSVDTLEECLDDEKGSVRMQAVKQIHAVQGLITEKHEVHHTTDEDLDAQIDAALIKLKPEPEELTP